jgi:type I restriction enzyme S subunit
MKYQTYPAYKDSGVEWLGDVPENWKLCRLKFMAKIKNGQDYKAVEVENGYPVIGSGGQFSYASEFTYDKASVLLGRKGTIDKPLYIDEPFWTVDTMYYTEINKNIYPKYLYYLALTIQFGRYSTSTALPSMTQEHLGNFIFAIPDYELDRKQIAQFLDHETAKIDTLIEKQQRLIELLKEKRQAVISHAVTKGLNPNVPMKDSGVEWLGDVPEGWEVKRLKDVLSEPVKNGLFKKKEQFGAGSFLVNVSDLYVDNNFINVETLGQVITTPDEKKMYKVKAGDIFFVRSSLKLEGIGRSACVLENHDDVVFECHIVNARPNKQLMSSKYLTRYLNSVSVSQEFVSRSKTTTMTTIDQGSLVTINVVIPPQKEQFEIDNYLDQQLDKMNRAEGYALNSINLLIERRTALISAAVTGKIDVRDWGD